MKKIKLSLGPDIPFWFLGSIKLTVGNAISPWIYVEKLPEQWIETINKSAKVESVFIYNENNKRLRSIQEVYEDDISIKSFPVEIDDIQQPEENLVPQVISATVTDEEEEEDVLLVSNEDREEAKRILGKNANTIKAMLKKIDVTEKYTLLMAMFEVESMTKNRSGLIDILKIKLGQ